MKSLTMFHFDGCPYCARARKYLAELKAERPELASVPVELIDEKREPELAEKYDYYYVPTFYLDGRKLHEGAATKQDVERALREALNA